MDHTEINYLGWCEGYGGIHLGLRRVIDRLRAVALCEIEAYAVSNLVAKMEAGLLDSSPIWTDLKTFPCEQFCGLVDVFSAGFPCQPFSLAGKKAADSDPRHLWPYILDGIRRIRPGVVFLENVEGIISSKLGGTGWSDPAGTPVLLHVMRELECVGYRATAGIFSAAEVGKSHRRKRVFILGIDDSEGARCDTAWIRTISEQSRGECVLGHGGGDMADTQRGLLGTGKLCVRDEEEFSINSKSSRALADAGCSERRPESEGPIRQESTDRDCECCGTLANSNIPGHEECRARIVDGNTAGKSLSAIDGNCRPLDDAAPAEGERFATFSESVSRPSGAGMGGPEIPGPRDHDAWYRILVEQGRIWLSPALTEAEVERMVCGAADGYSPELDGSNRIDRLRLCGNGVVPDTAAIAFVTLAKRIFL